jgi:hypothetical protein
MLIATLEFLYEPGNTVGRTREGAMMSARRISRGSTVTLGGALAVIIATASPGAAAPGDLDPSFGGDGKVTTDFAGGYDVRSGLAIQEDGFSMNPRHRAS